jgi:hypothetical protein
LVDCGFLAYSWIICLGALSNTFFLAKGDELFKAVLARGGASSGEESKFGAGGGHVTKDYSNQITAFATLYRSHYCLFISSSAS